MASSGPKCPRCGKKLRVKPGVTRTTPGERLAYQCKHCLITNPDACEWSPAMVAMLNEIKTTGENPDLDF